MKRALFLFVLAAVQCFGQAGANGRISGTGTQLFVTNPQTSTYQVIPSDFEFCKTIPVASGTFTITLVASTSQPKTGQCIRIINYGSGVVTVAPSGQNINGSGSNLTLAAGSASTPTGVYIVSDGTNYEAQPIGSATATCAPIGSPTANQILMDNGSGCPADATSAATAVTQAPGDNSTKVATTAYVTTGINNAIAGVNPAVAVLAASTANIVGTYSNGVSGIGATFTVTATGAFTLDGVAINTIGQRVLLKNQSTAFQNGVYTATVIGASLVSPVFTRALDYDQPSDINSTGAIPVQSGTVNATTSWLLTSTVNTVGTDALTYVQFSYAPSSIVTLPISLPPYLSAGGQLYIPADNMYLATLPNLTGYTAVGGTSAPTVTTNPNGDVVMSTSNSFYADPSHTISIEAVFRLLISTVSSTTSTGGLFICDSTNSKIYTFYFQGAISNPQTTVQILTFTSNGTCTTATFSAQTYVNTYTSGGIAHLKVSISGGTATYAISVNGGETYYTVATQAVGTILKLGYYLAPGQLDLFSAVVQ